MIAMAVLTVGLLAMWHLHVVGLTSTAAGRRHTVAVALARELTSGLERLGYADTLIDATYTAQGSTSPPPSTALFGNLVQGDGTLRTGNIHVWNDSSHAVPGVRLDAQLRERGESAGYERRWTVWDMISPQAGATTPGAKVIAVSVTWRDPPFARLREVVLYTQVANFSGLRAGLGTSP
jgi:hypothetical protein